VLAREKKRSGAATIEGKDGWAQGHCAELFEANFSIKEKKTPVERVAAKEEKVSLTLEAFVTAQR